MGRPAVAVVVDEVLIGEKLQGLASVTLGRIGDEQHPARRRREDVHWLFLNLDVRTRDLALAPAAKAVGHMVEISVTGGDRQMQRPLAVDGGRDQGVGHRANERGQRRLGTPSGARACAREQGAALAREHEQGATTSRKLPVPNEASGTSTALGTPAVALR